MKDPNINIEALKTEAISLAARVLIKKELHKLYEICETQKTVSTTIVYRHLERHHDILRDAAHMIRKLSDQL